MKDDIDRGTDTDTAHCDRDSTDAYFQRSVRFVLIRHARTEHNKLGIIQGQLDTEVDEEGTKEITRLTKRLIDMSLKEKKRIVKIYSSDLKRCFVTAKRCCDGLNECDYERGDDVEKKMIELERTTMLRERNVGSLQGLTRKEASRDMKEAWNVFCMSKQDIKLRCLGDLGESVEDVLLRVKSCIESIAQKFMDENDDDDEHDGETNCPRNSIVVCIVTHAGVLLLIREHLCAEDESGEKNRGIVRNCSIGEVDLVFRKKKERTNEKYALQKWVCKKWGTVDERGTADVFL
jgi:broad specificity phosphatase PhoE